MGLKRYGRWQGQKWFESDNIAGPFIEATAEPFAMQLAGTVVHGIYEYTPTPLGLTKATRIPDGIKMPSPSGDSKEDLIFDVGKGWPDAEEFTKVFETIPITLSQNLKELGKKFKAFGGNFEYPMLPSQRAPSSMMGDIEHALDKVLPASFPRDVVINAIKDALNDWHPDERPSFDRPQRVHENSEAVMSKLEKDIQKDIIAWLVEDAGCMVFKMSMLRGYGQAGWPDLLVCAPEGVVCFIEVKRPENHPTKIQKLRIKELRDRGHEVLVAHSLDEVVEWWNAEAQV